VKNPTTTAAFVLVGLALLVGGFAYLTSGDDAQDKPSDVITQGSSAKVGFTALTPREQRKKSNLEEAKRKLKRVKEQGKEVMPGVYRMKEENGEPIYYLSELVEGVGRNGEPLYMAVEFKRRPMVPLKQPRVLTGRAAPTVHPVVQDAIEPLKPHGAEKSAETGGGGTGGGTGKQGAGDLKDG